MIAPPKIKHNIVNCEQKKPLLTYGTVEQGVDPFKMVVVIIFRRIFNCNDEVCGVQVQILNTT